MALGREFRRIGMVGNLGRPPDISGDRAKEKGGEG